MRKVKIKDLELGQILYGNPVGMYKCPEYVIALVSYLINELKIVYWNKNQKEWKEHYGTDMPKLEIRPYYWGEDEKEATKPNFKFKEVEIRWYKYFGRSMTVNVKKTKKQWVKWFNECLEYIRSFDITNR